MGGCGGGAGGEEYGRVRMRYGSEEEVWEGMEEGGDLYLVKYMYTRKSIYLNVSAALLLLRAPEEIG